VTDEDGNLVRYKIKPHFKGQTPDKRNGEIYGEFLSSRFSKALGFFADDEWVADVNCPDLREEPDESFQGASFSPFQPAAGIELPLARGIDVELQQQGFCSTGRNTSRRCFRTARHALRSTRSSSGWRSSITATRRLTITSSPVSSRRRTANDPDVRTGRGGVLRQRHGIDFRLFAFERNKAKLDVWRKKNPIEVNGGRCTATAKSVGDTQHQRSGPPAAPNGLQHLLDAEKRNRTITGFSKLHER
jgi:hypothetical protein